MPHTPKALFVLVLAFGCAPQPYGPPPVVAPTTAPGAVAPSQTPSPRPGPGTDVMATVDGRPIYMRQLHAPLVEADGLRVSEMLVANAIVAHEAERRSITVTDADIADENDHWLGQINDAFRTELTGDQRQRLLDQLLRTRGLTRPLWRATMRRNALLRKMVAPHVTVTDPMLQAEFSRRYGEKVEVSHVQVATPRDAEKIIQLAKDGDDFVKLARQWSTDTLTARQGGRLRPFTKTDTSVPRAIRDAAFAMTRPAQISGIVQVREKFHVLKLRQRIAPPQQDFESVKDKLRDDLRWRLIERLQLQLLSELRGKADVEYIDPTLRTAVERQARP